MLLYQTRPSNAAHVLCDSLGIRRVGPDTTPIVNRRLARNRDGRILNWGNSHLPAWEVDGEAWVNKPEAVAVAVSKYQTLQKLAEADVDAVEVTRDARVAQGWGTDGRCLTRRDGLSGGQGIRHQFWEIADNQHFYAKVFPKTHEFRVHVFGENVIDFTEKKAAKGWRLTG
jgi:hypothetical protein